MELVIRNGTMVTAAGVSRADIGIADGKIAQIGGAFSSVLPQIDAAGCYVMPGGVDVHTHLDLEDFGVRSADDFGTGTIAAACGGTTTVVDFCSQARGQSLAEAIAVWDSKAQGRAAVDYGYHMIITDMTDAVFEELATLPERGITSFKLFMAYRGAQMIDDRALLKALDQARRHGALVMVHAENGDAADYLRDRYVSEGKTQPYYHALSRPPRIEAEATARAIALAEVVGAPLYVVHLTCGEALDEVLRAKRRGVEVLAETCTQYLYLTKEDLARPDFEGAKYVFTPPARTVADQDLLWYALADRVLETVSSDHCSWSFKTHKTRGLDDFRKIPNGAPGVEERMIMVYQGVVEGRISLTDFIDLVATRPAQVFGLFPQKGTIAVGSDADLVIWDPAAEMILTKARLHSAVDYSSYEGRNVKGLPRSVLLRGRLIVRDGEYVGTAGDGGFLPRARFQSRRVGQQ